MLADGPSRAKPGKKRDPASPGKPRSKRYNPSLIYEEIRHLGSGAFGAAFLVRRKRDGRRFVAKKCCIEGLNEKQRKMCLEEIALLRRVRHDCVAEYVDFRWSSSDKMNYWLMLKFYQGGDVDHRIAHCRDSDEELEEELIKSWITQLCMALEHVHNLHIVHRDVKPANMFLTGLDTLVLGDFGVSKQLTEHTKKALTSVGSPTYMAPEWWDGRGGTPASDMWSVGIVTFELTTLRRPFDAGNVLSLVHKITTEDAPDLPEECDVNLKEFVKQLLDKSPDQRPSASEALRCRCLGKCFETLNYWRTRMNHINDEEMRTTALAEDTAAGITYNVEGDDNDEEESYESPRLTKPIGTSNLVALARANSPSPPPKNETLVDLHAEDEDEEEEEEEEDEEEEDGEETCESEEEEVDENAESDDAHSDSWQDGTPLPLESALIDMSNSKQSSKVLSSTSNVDINVTSAPMDPETALSSDVAQKRNGTSPNLVNSVGLGKSRLDISSGGDVGHETEITWLSDACDKSFVSRGMRAPSSLNVSTSIEQTRLSDVRAALLAAQSESSQSASADKTIEKTRVLEQTFAPTPRRSTSSLEEVAAQRYQNEATLCVASADQNPSKAQSENVDRREAIGLNDSSDKNFVSPRDRDSSSLNVSKAIEETRLSDVRAALLAGQLESLGSATMGQTIEPTRTLEQTFCPTPRSGALEGQECKNDVKLYPSISKTQSGTVEQTEITWLSEVCPNSGLSGTYFASNHNANKSTEETKLSDVREALLSAALESSHPPESNQPLVNSTMERTFSPTPKHEHMHGVGKCSVENANSSNDNCSQVEATLLDAHIGNLCKPTESRKGRETQSSFADEIQESGTIRTLQSKISDKSSGTSSSTNPFVLPATDKLNSERATVTTTGLKTSGEQQLNTAGRMPRTHGKSKDAEMTGLPAIRVLSCNAIDPISTKPCATAGASECRRKSSPDLLMVPPVRNSCTLRSQDLKPVDSVTAFSDSWGGASLLATQAALEGTSKGPQVAESHRGELDVLRDALGGLSIAEKTMLEQLTVQDHASSEIAPNSVQATNQSERKTRLSCEGSAHDANSIGEEESIDEEEEEEEEEDAEEDEEEEDGEDDVVEDGEELEEEEEEEEEEKDGETFEPEAEEEVGSPEKTEEEPKVDKIAVGGNKELSANVGNKLDANLSLSTEQLMENDEDDENVTDDDKNEQSEVESPTSGSKLRFSPIIRLLGNTTPTLEPRQDADSSPMESFSVPPRHVPARNVQHHRPAAKTKSMPNAGRPPRPK